MSSADDRGEAFPAVNKTPAPSADSVPTFRLRSARAGADQPPAHATAIPKAIDLSDPAIFGNEAGEEELPDVLRSYFLDKNAFASFYDDKTPLAIIRARKGIGKSALLARVSAEKIEHKESCLTATGPELRRLASFSDLSDAHELVNHWQDALVHAIYLELLRTLEIPASEAEATRFAGPAMAGLGGKSLLTALIQQASRLDCSPEAQETLRALAARAEAGARIWVFIDDIDSTFIDTPQNCLKVATFFSACRGLIAKFPNLLIRASVRTDVWSTVRRTDESLDKCDQYVVDLSWELDEATEILARKIRSYFARNHAHSYVPSTCAKTLHLVLDPKFRWDKRDSTPDWPIYRLSAGRPRWATQLLKLAGTRAKEQRHPRITANDVIDVLPQFGQRRLDDLYAEHGHQCDWLRRLVEAFSGGAPRYSTAELLEMLTRRIIRVWGVPLIEGRIADGARDLARFLYRIDFIFGRQEDAPGRPRHVKFEERQDLLRDNINLDDGMVWEVHPIFRRTLRIYGDDRWRSQIRRDLDALWIPETRTPSPPRRREIVVSQDARAATAPSARRIGPSDPQKTRILFLAANPASAKPLRLDEEAREITQKIRAADSRNLDLQTRWATRPDDLLQYFNQDRPSILHFSGHGNTDEEIILLDVAGNPKPVSGQALVSLFRTFANLVSVVVLNACYSAKQAAGIADHVPCVIGMRKAIGDRAAILFAASFYRALGFGHSVQQAFDQGRTAIVLEGVRGEETPVLLTRKGTSASDIRVVELLT